jgi:hypothetical protein
MFSKALSARNSAAIWLIWVAFSWNGSSAEKAVVVKKRVASSSVFAELLWKKGGVSAASISDVVLNLPSPKPSPLVPGPYRSRRPVAARGE